MQPSPKRRVPRWLWVILGIVVFCCLAGVVFFILLNTVWAPQCAPPPCLADRNYTLVCPAGARCVNGCSMVCATKTPYELTITPNPPMIICTAPPCKAGEVYYCSGECPGGCGTTCATPTAVKK